MDKRTLLPFYLEIFKKFPRPWRRISHFVYENFPKNIRNVYLPLDDELPFTGISFKKVN